LIVVVGLSHKTAPVDVREKFAASADVLPVVLEKLRARREVREVMFLSTCNRVEVFVSPAPGEDPVDAGIRAVRETFAEYTGQPTTEIAPYLYEKSGDSAVQHIFRVAASLDSMVLGEPQILGQVKDAYDAAMQAGALGSFLGRAVHRAFTVAKRVRTETQIGAGTVSISSVAVDLAKKIFGDLAHHSVLLVGAGEMAEQAAKSLGRGAKSIRVCNRSFERAAHLASQFGGTAAPLEALEEELLVSDVVVTSTGAKHFIVTKDLVKRVMKARKGRTLFFIDIAVPRNVDPDAHRDIDNVYVYNVDDLEQIVADGLKSRQREVAAAEKIVADELQEFATWARGLHVQPTIVALRNKTKGILMAELERSLTGKLKHLGDADRAALGQMIDASVNKLLHTTTTRLKASTDEDDGEQVVRIVKHLFDLPDTPVVLAPKTRSQASSAAPPPLEHLEEEGDEGEGEAEAEPPRRQRA
jgi:glutamyl-tRNA reductase